MDDQTLVELAERGPQTESFRDLADKVTSINLSQFRMSESYKLERMGKIKKYEMLYQGYVPRKFRQLFSIPFPVFQSFIDTLESDFSDPITAKFKEQDPSDYFKVKKIQAAWDRERESIKPSSMWDLKVRLDKKNALMSGRGIQRYYASSEPEYQSHFEAISYQFFHCQPTGGPVLERHLFTGEEMVLKSREQLEQGVDAGIYDEQQVRMLIARQGNKDFVKDLPDTMAQKFRALGLDPNSHNYVGEETYALNQWCSTYKGTRWYNLFDPFTKMWIRFDKLKEVYSGDYYPYTSWATHEDPQIFWSVGYSDFFYPIADAIMTMVNQELTNREKSNFNARAYDEEMFTDDQKLDEAQYRPDALVPVNTVGGTRKISDGIYRFDTPQLQGTIDLSNWLYQQAGQLTASGMLNAGAPAQKGEKAYLQLMQQAQISKRLSYKAQSYQETYQGIALRFIQGLKDHMPARMALRMEGPEGYDNWEEITRMDLSLKRDPRITIESTTVQEQQNKIKTEEKMSALTAIAGSPHINERTRVEFILREAGHFDEMDLSLLMDVNSSVDKEVQAKAAIAIKNLVERKTPEVNYAADLAYMKIIHKFMVDHLVMLKKRGLADSFVAYIKQIAPLVQKNMQQLAQQIKQERAMQQSATPQQPQQPIPHKPSAKGKMNTKAPALGMQGNPI